MNGEEICDWNIFYRAPDKIKDESMRVRI